MSEKRSGELEKSVSAPPVRMSRSVVDESLQIIFADEARNALGMPTLDECRRLLLEFVVITLNHDFTKRVGKLTRVVSDVGHEYLVLDDDEDDVIPYRAIQAIRQLERKELYGWRDHRALPRSGSDQGDAGDEDVVG